jgi:hypothetical protein
MLRKIDNLGDHGKMTIASLFHLHPVLAITASSFAILAALIILRNGFPQ